jgi:small-conductance mechanosensitive channel
VDVGLVRSEATLAAGGIAFAIALVLLVRFLLPKSDRGRIKIAAVYAALATIFGLVDWLLPARAKVVEFFYWFFLLASIGRSLVLLSVDVAFGRRTHRTAPRIFRDFTQAIVYVVVALLTLRAIGVEPGSLLTTSALLTAVVGLALQDTLGNLVSGLALQMQRPFEVGDWIQFDPDPRQTGHVTEVNWRATTVMTSDLVEVIVPNATLAKAPIRNYSRPSKISRRSVQVQGPYDVPPLAVQDAILAALKGTPGVLRDPPPWVQTKTFADSGIEYAVYFFTDDYDARERTDGFVRDRVWYALQRAAVTVPFPHRTVHLTQLSEESEDRDREKELSRRDRILRCVEFLDVLPAEAHRALAGAASVRLYAPGEVIVSQGEQGGELFVIERGEVVVELTTQGRQLPVARLGAGKFFGEMGLMTGEPRTATVRAATSATLMVIGKDAFHDTIAPVPGIVEKLSTLLAERQAELESAAESRRPSIEIIQDRSKRLISQIKSFFNL